MSKQAIEFVFPDVLDLISTESLLESFEDLYSKGSDVVADSSSILRITTPAIQVIVAFAAAIDALGHKFTIKNPNDVVKEAFELLGLAELLEKWSV